MLFSGSLPQPASKNPTSALMYAFEGAGCEVERNASGLLVAVPGLDARLLGFGRTLPVYRGFWPRMAITLEPAPRWRLAYGTPSWAMHAVVTLMFLLEAVLGRGAMPMLLAAAVVANAVPLAAAVVAVALCRRQVARALCIPARRLLA